MGTILLVAADKREVAGVLRRCRRLERLRWPVESAWRGELAGQRVVVVADGSGRARAAQATRRACERERVEAVVSTGWCGALDAALEPGEIFVASEVQAAGEAVSYAAGMPRTERSFRSGRLATVDRVLRSAGEKGGLRQTGAAAVDMEAAAVAAESASRGLKFFCVRAVLDGAGEGMRLDFNAARGENGRFSRARIVRAALRRPWAGVPELAKWARRSVRSARALGDFLSECRFEA